MGSGSVGDQFNRAAGGLVAPWVTVKEPSCAIQIELIGGDPATGRLYLRGDDGAVTGCGFAYYDSGLLTANQKSEAGFVSQVAGVPAGLGVRLSGASVAAVTGYWVALEAGYWEIFRLIGGDLRSPYPYGGTSLGTAGTMAVGDLVRLEMIGTQLRLWRNGGVLTTIVDANIATGKPGFVTARTSPPPFFAHRSFDSWNAGSRMMGLRVRR